MKTKMHLSTSLNAITWLTGREPKTVYLAHHRAMARLSEAAGFEITPWAYAVNLDQKAREGRRED